MSRLRNIHRRVCVIAALHLIAGAVMSGSAATSSAQETARPPILGSGASHASSSPLISNGSPVPLRLAQAQVGRPMEKITFLLDFTPYGKHAPFFAALDKGFWKDAGFDVTIVKGLPRRSPRTRPARSTLHSRIRRRSSSHAPKARWSRSPASFTTSRSMPSERWKKTTSRRRRISKASESVRASVTQAE